MTPLWFVHEATHVLVWSSANYSSCVGHVSTQSWLDGSA